jgi:hypothetical protein
MRVFIIFLLFIHNLFAIDFSLKGKELYTELKNYDEKYKISQKKEWREISGWDLWILGYSANNQDPRGYATPKGLDNPSEDFIDFAMEYIHPKVTTIQNSIKCRTSRKYAFLKKTFKDFKSPLEQEDIICDKVDKGFLNDLIFTSPINGKPIEFGDINEDTIEGFELLYATPGTGDASEIAGHLLLRVKLNNNPLAKKLNMQNPHDIVVSFLANTRDKDEIYEEPKVQKECKSNFFNIVDNNSDFNAIRSIYQSLKGLAGGFLTLMDRQTLAQSVKHYTIEEDRNLLRFELILTKEQKKSLIDHLFYTKKNYNARYYFFTQNCASVLVKIIGQGIKVKEISEFDPITSPPNTLVALFTKLGLAKPVYPSFYSYRKKAFMAQDTIKEYYKELQTKYKHYKFPDLNLLLNKDVDDRVLFIKELEKFYEKHQRFENELYKLSTLIQNAEMAYEHKNLVCENYTSKLTTQTRIFQDKLLNLINDPSIKVESTINKKYKAFEELEYNNGQSHTNLLSFGVGYGKNNSKKILHLEASIVKQEMGSLSNIAMQRGNSVKLGSFDINLLEDAKVANWEFTALNIKKLKERLDTIPSYFSYSGEFGLGLNVLDYKGNHSLNYMEGSIIGGELLFNMISSKSQEDYLFISLGSQMAYQKYNDISNTGLSFPIYLQNMFSFGEKRELQWQTKLSYAKAIKEKMDSRKNFMSELRYKLPFNTDAQYLAKVKYEKQFKSKNLLGDETFYISLEVNNW